MEHALPRPDGGRRFCSDGLQPSGAYFTYGDAVQEQSFTIAPDPRWENLPADYRESIAPLEEVMQNDIPQFNQWLK